MPPPPGPTCRWHAGRTMGEQPRAEEGVPEGRRARTPRWTFRWEQNELTVPSHTTLVLTQWTFLQKGPPLSRRAQW